MRSRGGNRLPKQEKGAMARQIVYFCIRFLAAVTVWAMLIKTIGAFTGNSVDLSDVMTPVCAVFGGELLFLLVKRIFAKPSEIEQEETNS